jgi:hypothetical protein
MAAQPPCGAELVDLGELAERLDLPADWLLEEAKHARIPRLVVQGPYRRKLYRFNPAAVKDCLALRASLGHKLPSAGEGET